MCLPKVRDSTEELKPRTGLGASLRVLGGSRDLEGKDLLGKCYSVSRLPGPPF